MFGLFAWILLGTVADAECTAANSGELASMYSAWHTASKLRETKDYTTLKADQDRVARARQLAREGSASSADDRYYTGVLLLMSDDFADIDLAYRMADGALSAGHPNARALLARALDTTLFAQGLPQKYGTQMRWQSGVHCLIEVSGEIGDATRAAFGQPSLADRLR